MPTVDAVASFGGGRKIHLTQGVSWRYGLSCLVCEAKVLYDPAVKALPPICEHTVIDPDLPIHLLAERQAAVVAILQDHWFETQGLAQQAGF